jgi:FKBP-type peptidyl-prolyl cis-trans isomerase SlyD
MKIDKNSFVCIDYLIRLGENETFPPDGQPEEISFCMGWGAMPPGLEEAMLGLEPGDQKLIRLSAAEAYGEFDPELLMEVPRADFDPEAELQPGLVFETKNDEGDPVYFIVQEVKDDKVIIDFNHPLAGRDLEINFMVRQVREATQEELQGPPNCTCAARGEGGAHSH